MKILVACEESQEVCKAFRARGFEAYSNDLVECSGGHPEWHLRMCSLEAMELQKWDLVIAHPPCTYLTSMSAARLLAGGKINQERYKQGLIAKQFFMLLYTADCEHVAVENPTPLRLFNLPQYSQIIQPYEHGDPYQKRTCLWLRGLPKLEPSKIITENVLKWVNVGSRGGTNSGVVCNQRLRSKTFPGIARAMAEQWGNYLLNKRK